MVQRRRVNEAGTRTATLQKRQNITIKEVAEMAGVSQMTVSRVLNNQSLVKETTRERVHQAIRQLKYRPNILARGLAGGQSLYIGLIYTNPSYAYLSEFLFGALDALSRPRAPSFGRQVL